MEKLNLNLAVNYCSLQKVGRGFQAKTRKHSHDHDVTCPSHFHLNANCTASESITSPPGVRVCVP